MNSFERVVAIAPGIDSSQQWPDARDPSSLEEQRGSRAAHLVWAGTVKDHVAVRRNFTMFYFVHRDKQRAAYQRRVLSNFFPRPQIENYRLFSPLQFVVQFVYANSGSPQFAQQATTLEIFVRNVKGRQAADHGERARPETGKGADDLLQLLAEED